MGKGRSHASQFPESQKFDKCLAGLSAWTWSRVMWTRPQVGNLPLASPVGVRCFTVSSFRVCEERRKISESSNKRIVALETLRPYTEKALWKEVE
jgi:hypothetical protein